MGVATRAQASWSIPRAPRVPEQEQASRKFRPPKRPRPSARKGPSAGRRARRVTHGGVALDQQRQYGHVCLNLVRRQKMRDAQPLASIALGCHRIRVWSAPKQLRQFTRTFPRPPCSLGAPGALRRPGALVGSQRDKPSVRPPRVRYSALRHQAAGFRACQPPNPSIERDVQGLSPLAAPHVKR